MSPVTTFGRRQKDLGLTAAGSPESPPPDTARSIVFSSVIVGPQLDGDGEASAGAAGVLGSVASGGNGSWPGS